MDLLWLRKFAVLLWKIFLIKRRKLIGLVVEIGLTFLLLAFVLLNRRIVHKKFHNASTFDPLPLILPALTNTSLVYELVYVPSGSDVAKNITEMVKRDLNFNFKVQGFSSEEDFEKYIKYENKCGYVLAAIVFDHDFKNKNDSLPLKVKYHLRFRNSNAVRNGILGMVDSQNVDWDTSMLFPIIPSIGPRNPLEADGGDPGEQILEHTYIAIFVSC
ncbi:phospholipid-transporting ATPase ABCA3-like [Nycticebus coucang]|uniref:phospholipid-transporting ATPase ABCA3-like n=1 Tax=Nycticebus coucang TaxID=9470 RepID=UPI00234DF0AA|nr:phospholipid-transporting ATPase ABCA3-like [Nycticebus coucang]